MKRGRKKGQLGPLLDMSAPKLCTWCGQTKTRADFYQKKSQGNTPNRFCIPCDNEVTVLYNIKRRMAKHGIDKIEAEIRELSHDIDRRLMVATGEFDDLVKHAGIKNRGNKK